MTDPEDYDPINNGHYRYDLTQEPCAPEHFAPWEENHTPYALSKEAIEELRKAEGEHFHAPHSVRVYKLETDYEPDEDEEAVDVVILVVKARHKASRREAFLKPFITEPMLEDLVNLGVLSDFTARRFDDWFERQDEVPHEETET